jgi:hypothetical protein
MSERYQVTLCDDGQWMVHTEGDIIAHPGQGNEEQKARAICAALNGAAATPPCPTTQEALKALSDWCEKARYELGGIDGYDYRSGEEFGIRRVELQIEKVLHATAVSRPHRGGSLSD